MAKGGLSKLNHLKLPHFIFSTLSPSSVQEKKFSVFVRAVNVFSYFLQSFLYILKLFSFNFMFKTVSLETICSSTHHVFYLLLQHSDSSTLTFMWSHLITFVKITTQVIYNKINVTKLIIFVKIPTQVIYIKINVLKHLTWSYEVEIFSFILSHSLLF